MAEKEGRFIVWVPEKEKVIVIDRWYWELKDINDPITGVTKKVNTLTYHVISEDGVPCDKYGGATGKRMQAQLLGLDAGGSLVGKPIGITAHGFGFKREYSFRTFA